MTPSCRGPRSPPSPGDTEGRAHSPSSARDEILFSGGAALAGPFPRRLQPPRGRGPLRRPLQPSSVPSSVYGVVWDPLEAKREVCELNPDCDELADHIGFQEAYRRFYGPV